jgi:hypothetical protein
LLHGQISRDPGKARKAEATDSKVSALDARISIERWLKWQESCGKVSTIPAKGGGWKAAEEGRNRSWSWQTTKSSVPPSNAQTVTSASLTRL